MISNAYWTVMSRWLLLGIACAAIFLALYVTGVQAVKGGRKVPLSSRTHTTSTSCLTPKAPSFGRIDCHSEGNQMICTAKCEYGYRFLDNSLEKSMRCTYGIGSWRPPMIPNCIRQYGNGNNDIPPDISGHNAGGTHEVEGPCSTPFAPPFSTVRCESIYDNGRKCYVQCDAGYVLPDRATYFQTECFPHSNRWMPPLSGAKCTVDHSGDSSGVKEGHGGDMNTDGTGMIDARTKVSGLCELPSSKYVHLKCQMYNGIKTCEGTCAEGLYFRGTSSLTTMKLTCEFETGNWSPRNTFPDCISSFPACSEVNAPVNGKGTCKGFNKSNKNCTGICLYGSFPGGSKEMVLICNEGVWINGDRFPNCQSYDPECSKLNPPMGGRIACGGISKSDMNCTATCLLGSFPDGSKEKMLTCNKGVWINGDQFPSCKSSFPACSEVNAPVNGKATCKGFNKSNKNCTGICLYGSFPGGSKEMTLICNEGVWINGDHFPNCQSYDPECSKLNPPMGGRIACKEISKSDMNCTATCLHGSFPDGSKEKMLTCNKGVWINGDQVPSCKSYRKTCGNPIIPGGVRMHCDLDEHNSNRICKGTCGGDGYKRIFVTGTFQVELICRNGGWINGNEFPRCQTKSGSRPSVHNTDLCKIPPDPANGKSKCNKTTTEKTCVAWCNARYSFGHNSHIETITCQLTAGNWLPKSTFSDCTRICDPACQNGGHCTESWTCLCPNGYHGRQCQYRTAVESNETMPADTEWDYVFQKQGHEVGGEHVSRRPPFQLATSKSTGVCVVWSTNHYRTFDGYIYDYAGSCSYILAKDHMMNIFAITLEHDKGCVNRRVRSGTKCYRTVKIKLGDAVYQLYAGPRGVELSQNGKRLPIPYTQGINVEYVARYVVATLYQDTTVWIDGTDAIYIITSEIFKKGIQGLCGNYDDNHNNDMMKPNGALANNIITFGNSWKVEEMGVCEDVVENIYNDACRHDSPENDKIAENAAAKCLDINEYKYCHKFVRPEYYIEACKIDCCDQEGQQGCECSSFAEYFRECARLYLDKSTAWRKPALCPMKCENGTQYQDCGSACPVTCGAPEIPCAIKTCVDGCHCPEGMALHEGQCIPASECPCQHNDHWYQHGTSVNINCKKCVCQGGKWECTENTCPAICSSVGDSHFTTFDGKRYNYVGSCSYYLVRQDDGYAVEQENSDCLSDTGEYELASHKEPFISCKKTVILKTPQGTIVKLKHGMEVSVNGKEVLSLPHLAPGVSIRQLTSLYQEAEFSTGLKIVWDGWNRIYIIAPATLFGKVQGLCGTFNNFQNDDFITPAGDQEKSVKFFAEKWKVPNGCHDVLSLNTLVSSPCDYHTPFQKQAENVCSKIKSEIFKDCKTVVDPEPFYKNCMYDVCSCKSDISSCFCLSLANYALVCARNNVSVDWRPHIPNCGLRCIGRQQYQTYSKSCEYSCRQIALLPECETEFVEGCACPSGETLDANGNCIPISQCPCIYHNHEYAPNFVQRRGTKTCTCTRGQWKCHTSTLEEIMTTPPSEVLTCLDSDHKEYTDCVSDCPVTCTNIHDPPTCTMLSCKSGCRCQRGYVLNEDNGACVKPEDCPCHHGRRSYKDDEKIRIDCKECICHKGHWKCDKEDCPGVCSAWGNSHFMTFDGHFYNFQGTCEYVLVSGKITENEMFSIIIQNEKCGSNGITCNKMISFAIGNNHIMFSKSGPPPRVDPDSQFTVKEVGMFYYVSTNIGISLQWDKGTRVYVHALPIWSGKLKGLCGDFNGDSVDDFKQPSGNIAATQAVDFANSWKMHSYCEKPLDIPETCAFHSERREWALQKCKILKSSLFSECHSEVDLEPYYESCIFDTCACDMGGDCECLCTAIAAYAYECARNGIYIYWRSQELCPIQCEECDHYSPCISTCPPTTCETEDSDSQEKICKEGPCSEGCEKNACPPGEVYNNMKDRKCIPKEECIIHEQPFVCKNVNGRDYKEGERIDDPEISDECRTCYCTRQGPQCSGHACSTPYGYTTEEENVCTSGWSQWLNFSSPSFAKTYRPMCPIYLVTDIECRPNDNECAFQNALNCLNGDYQEIQLCLNYEIRVYCSCADFEESFGHTEEPSTEIPPPPTECGLPMYTDWMVVYPSKISTLPELTLELRKTYSFCADDDILSVECDISPKQGISHSPKRRNIKKCAAPGGKLICGPNTKRKACKVRVLCNCVIKDLQLPNVTCLEMTPWINFDSPDDDGIDFESLHRIPAIKKVCPKITTTQCKNLLDGSSRPPPASDFNIRCTGGEVACKSDSINTCPNYAVRSSCKCKKKPVPPATPKPTSKPSPSTVVCPPGLVWDDCAVNCEQTCEPFRNQLIQKRKCTSDNHCVAGCRQHIACSYPKVWRDEQTCIAEHECPCLTKDGSIVGPNRVVKSDCEKCHCFNNMMNCVIMANCTSDQFERLQNLTEENVVGDDCWTKWLNSDKPTSGAGDFEKLSVLQQFYNFCSHPIEVQCRDAETKRDAKDSNQDVICDKTKGLSCWNNRTQCRDYEVRFFCPCSAATVEYELKSTTTSTPQICKQGWSIWFNSYTADDTGDRDNLQLVEQNTGEKICNNGTVTSVKCQRKKDGLSYLSTNQYVTCDLENGLLCESSKQFLGVKCDDYEIAFFCDCFHKTTEKLILPSVYSLYPTSTTGRETSKETAEIMGTQYITALPSIAQTSEQAAEVTRTQYVTALPSIAQTSEQAAEATRTQYVTALPSIAPACWEFVPLINGESKLPDTNLKATSERSSEYGAQSIRIPSQPHQRSGRAWIPATINKDQYVEIDLSKPRLIYGIITQGRGDYQEWVTSYYILYSHDGYYFTKYQDPHSSEEVISGNYDSESLVKIIFDAPFEARYVRIQPNTWEGQIALRVELLGCSNTSNKEHPSKTYACLEPMGLENGKLADAQMTASSQHDWSHTPSDARIGGSGWVAAVSDNKQYLEVDFLDSRIISAIITQGRKEENQWVSAYMVEYSSDRNKWTTFSEEQDKSKLKIFPANYDSEHLVTNYLPHNIRTRYLRIRPVQWKNWISMKLEILGCYHEYREIITTTSGEVIYAIPTEEGIPSCLQPMGLSSPALDAEHSLPDNLITVSSSVAGADSSRLRLNTKAEGRKKGGWIPEPKDRNPFVQIDFLIPSTLTSVTTKGIEGTDRWISSYRIFVSNNTYQWITVYSDQNAIFEGNTDDNTEKNNMFDSPVTARYFKLEVIREGNPHLGLRLEVFGCYHTYETLPSTQVTPSIESKEEGECIMYGDWKSLSDPTVPGSKGDFENINDIIANTNVCTNPIDIECRTYVGHTSYKETRENVTCDLTNGLSCWNTDKKRCYNYEVRIKCWTCAEESDNRMLLGRLCPELPRHMANCSICPNKLVCNGTSCIDEADCPCIHGNKKFWPGYKITTNQCEECICSLGGHSKCYKKSCDICLPEQRPKLLPDCSCTCESCRQGEKMCSTNKKCILEKQWCDGIVDCPDDEINCQRPTISEITTPPPRKHENATCELLGKRIRTVDGQELDYEICDHVVFMDALHDNFNVTVRKECSGNPPSCHKLYLIQQDETSVIIDNDMTVTINGNNYTASQLTLFNKQNSNITVEIVGNHVYVKSKVYGFTVIRDQRANLKVEMSPELKNRVTGLCGLYNGKIFDDKKKPDGRIAATSKEFGDSWTSNVSKECVSSNCSTESVEKALEICKNLREDPFDVCKDYLNLESYVQACVSTTCDCLMESGDKTSECKCAAFLPLLEACENKVHRPLSKWRSKHGCAPRCPQGFVWEDCGSTCQLTCDSINMQQQTCLETCVPGCFCPAGTVLDGKKCILPEECSNAVCQGFGDPHFSTFDGWYYPFQAAGRFVLATDKKNTFSIEGKSGKCSPSVNGTCVSALTINFQNNIVNIAKGKPIAVGNKFISMDELPLEVNGITILGFPGKVYLVVIPSLSIVVRYYEINDGFSINIPSERFHNNTRGLCGNCNGKENDEMIPAYDTTVKSVSDFVCTWVKDESFSQCKKSFHEKSIETKEDSCPEILDSTFSSCHPLVDPTLYQKSCNYDVAYSSDRHDAICKTLMEYARQCCEAGVVLSDWFIKYNCVIPCPNGTIYHHCHDACPQTCQNNSETVNCHDLKTDGCFCPENKVLKDDVCVDEIYCKLPEECTYTLQYDIDGEGKQFLLPADQRKPTLYKKGETWQDGLCRNCICKENNGQYFPDCNVTECPDYEKLPEYLDYVIRPVFKPGKCCPTLLRSHCKDEDGEIKNIREKWNSKTNPCKEFECALDSEGEASKITKDVKCECKMDEEQQPPVGNECCGRCVKKYCIFQRQKYSVGDQWTVGCYTGECIEKDGEILPSLQKNCSEIPSNCPKDKRILDQNRCCTVCNATIGAVGCNTKQVDWKIGEFEKEIEDHGKCVNSNPETAVTKCSGICESESMYSLENGEVASSCKCCSPVDIQVRDIELKCEDGTRQTLKLKHPTTCKCSPCAASVQNKDATKTSGKTGSPTINRYEKYSKEANESKDRNPQQNENDIQGSQSEQENLYDDSEY